MNLKQFFIAGERGRIRLELRGTLAGNDLALTLFGGDSPHMGCTVLSQPRPSLRDPEVLSSTASVINVSGHKDDELLIPLAKKLSSALNRTVSLCGGVHLDGITEEEIRSVTEMAGELGEELIGLITAPSPDSSHR